MNTKDKKESFQSCFRIIISCLICALFGSRKKDGLSNKALFTFSDATVDVKPQLQKESMNFIYTNIQSSYLTAWTKIILGIMKEWLISLLSNFNIFSTVYSKLSFSIESILVEFCRFWENHAQILFLFFCNDPSPIF